jgi:imidazolonepropionase-like amidohydrolase
MFPCCSQFHREAIVILLVVNWLTSVPSARAVDRRPGFQPSVYALENVTAVRGRDGTIEAATIVLRNGVIEAAGPPNEVTIPFDAERIDGTGLYAYAGFIDGYTTAGVDAKANRSRTGEGQRVDYGSFALGATPPDNRNGLTPEFQVADALALDEKTASTRRAVGFTGALVAPGGGIATGQSALVSLNGRPRREIIMASPIGLHVSLRSTGNRDYPTTLMGFVAHLRQAMIDARHYESLWDHYQDYGGPRPPLDPTLRQLRLAQTGDMRIFWEANTRDEIHRALDLAHEFGLSPVIVGGREAWRVADRLAAADIPVVLRIDFPEEPKSAGAGGSRGRGLPDMTLDQFREVLRRPDLPDGYRSRIEQHLRELEQKSAPSEAKEDQQKLPESPRLMADAKRRWQERIKGAALLAEKGVRFCFSTDGHDKPGQFSEHLRQCIEHGLSPESALKALTTSAADVLGASDRLGRLSAGHAAHVVVFDGPFHEAKSKLRYAFVDADRFELNKPDEVKQTSDKAGESEDDEAETEKEKPSEEPKPQQDVRPDKEKAANDQPDKGEPNEEKTPDIEPFPTEVEEDRKPSFHTNGSVAIRDATILTVTKGTIDKGTILVQGGKITAVGTDVEIPAGVHVVEAEGLYVMPGMVDTHSHIAISGGTNESSLAVVPEVRVKDVVSGESPSMFRALAGGLTTARLLHGSANPIGGQDAVIKLRWGQAGRDLILCEGPRGVKFALGENPKRSSSRYPDTRLGVEAVIRRSFEEGRMYRRLWQLYAAARSRGENVPEPRRDLRLEALGDIAHGDLPIHCHCYRADEILMLMRLAESYGIRIRSLQHVLEGYKVAAEIAAHGASNSTFSDWWAYKVEAYDAIPHNTALLVQAGAEVTLKSDDAELMRHMNQEAAKTLRYGGLSEDQALRTVTINAARQIGLDHRLGSIEVGKDADLAIFNGHPLNAYARCEMAIIDGEVYFERRGQHNAGGYELAQSNDAQHDARFEGISAQRGKYALINARIVPVVGEIIESGTVVIEGTTIAAVGGSDAEVPRDATRIDLAGLSVYPGMINAGGTVGLTEVGSLPETQDYSERGQFNADIRASIALNPDSEIIPVTRASGILATLTHPSGGVISGQSVLLNLHGWIPPEMVVADPAALHINFPEGSYSTGSSQTRARERIEELKERFRLAVRYDRVRQQSTQGPDQAAQVDTKLEALAPYAQGRGLVVIHANNHGDILAAIEFSGELGLKWLLADAAEAWKCVADLKKNALGVILGPSMSLPDGNGAPYDAVYRTAAMLHEAGVPFAMTSGDNAPQARNLPFQAAMAVAYGLPPVEGLKAVTIYPAQLLGVDDRLGSIEPGKLANLVICDGDLLQPATDVKAMFIAGRPLAPTNRHTELYARYQQRLREVQSGLALLGVEGPLTPQLVGKVESEQLAGRVAADSDGAAVTNEEP